MLEILWFVLIAVLFTGFFFLEGFDYGVGTLLPFITREDREKRVLFNSIGPFWDGNEVWLLTAGGAMFASFPHWYATLFSGFYLPLVLMLFFLIYRGVSFEFRHLEDGPRWKKTWDLGFFLGSAGPALLWGVAFANFIRGVPIDETMTYTGGFFNLLNPFALLGGVLTVLLFTFHGALFLGLRTSGRVLENARSAAAAVGPFALLLTALYVLAALWAGHADALAPDGLAGGGMLLSVAAALFFQRRANAVPAFVMTGLSTVFYTVFHFAALFPDVMISSTSPEFNISIQEAASSFTTLKTMTIIALIFVPVVLAYQIWTFRIFRKRISVQDELKY